MKPFIYFAEPQDAAHTIQTYHIGWNVANVIENEKCILDLKEAKKHAK